jgi:hypothetical protein
MKVTVLVPSEAYRSYAGVRIRYDRITAPLERNGIELRLEDIGHFDPSAADCDAIVISKCHDARAFVAAAELSARGKLVGVDLFDDYFSQASDSRLTRYRNWLSQLIDLCDFGLCSTRAMSEVAQTYRSSLPMHIMNDPAPSESFAASAAMSERKLTEARDLQEIRVCWFGVGDNAYFPVGLMDLAAYGNMLAALSRTGFDVRLKVVTNTRALSADGLAILRQLPVLTEIQEWSEEAEEDALNRAFLAFLPVSAQPFSVAKSLNRAVTALSAGCQVLSAGYPLYEVLDAFVYRDPATLLEDLERGEMRFSAASELKRGHVLKSCASAEAEAHRLAGLLSGLPPPPPADARSLCLIHGHSTRLETHKFVRHVNGLSIASPFCTAPFDFDVLFRGGQSGLTMFVSNSATERLLPDARAGLKPGKRFQGRHYHQISRSRFSNDEDAGSWFRWENAPISFQLATYRASLSIVERALTNAFGPCRTFVSETRPLPFPIAGQAS